MKITIPLLIAALIIGGCSSVTKLAGNDDAGAASTDGALFQKQKRDGIAVSYSIDHYKFGGVIGGYRLSIMVENDGEATKLFRINEISILDGSRTMMLPMSYEDFSNAAGQLSGTPMPMIPPPQTGSTFSGSATNTMTGQTYHYYGDSTPQANFNSGFSSGLNTGAAIGAGLRRKAGNELQAWAGSNWLRGGYDIPAGARVTGLLFISALKPRPLPITTRVTVNDQEFKFNTKPN